MARTLRLFAQRKRAIGPLLVFLVLVLIVLPLLVFTGWLAGEIAIEQTSGVEFCTTCHTMVPMAESYQQDVHGGRSRTGVQASCSGCHLPHDNPFIFLFGKARLGVRDVWAQLAYDLENIDWEAKRLERESFVYDSGCLHCHRNLQNAVSPSSAAADAHKSYFLGESDKQCVTCHESVGHKDLSAFLEKS